MKRSPRPFTVEIKSSRRSSQNAAPILTGMPRTAPPLHLWSGDRKSQDSLRERSTASLAALDEANRLFAKLITRTPVLAQSSDPRPSERVSVQAQQPPSRVDEPTADPSGRVQ